MSGRSWTFDGLQFRMLMEQAGRDRLPFPLQYRPTAESAADYHRQRHEANEAVAGVMDEDLDLAVRTIVAPRIRVELVGHARTTTAGTAATKLRAHAAIGHDLAVVLTQQPGADDTSGGSIAVALLQPYRAVEAALAVLPAKGRGAFTRIDVERPSTGPEAEYSTPLIRRTERKSGEDQYARMFGRAPECAGEILVCPGPSPDSRPTDGTEGIHWVDFADDGRYVIRHSDLITVLPASGLDLVAEVRQLIEKVTVAF